MCHNHHLRRAKARAHGFLLHHSARLHTTAQSFLLEWRAQLHTVSYIRPRLLSSPEARGPPPPPLNYRPEPSQPLCLEQQNRNNLLQSTFHQVARSEIAPQSNNGSCPIICPRLCKQAAQMGLLDAKWTLHGMASLLPQLRAN